MIAHMLRYMSQLVSDDHWSQDSPTNYYHWYVRSKVTTATLE